MIFNMFWLPFLVIFCHLSTGLELKNITQNIFGDQVNILPVAFGDFNSDKLTDVFVLNQDRTKLSILLAREQTFSSVLTEQTYFLFPDKKSKKLKLECSINDATIESIIPGDFDGDGGMDVFVLVKYDDDADDMVMNIAFGLYLVHFWFILGFFMVYFCSNLAFLSFFIHVHYSYFI